MDIINLPENAKLYADFQDYIAEDEVASTIGETLSGKKHIFGAPNQPIIGKRVVGFIKVLEGGGRRPGSGRFVGWRKEVSRYVIDGAGAPYRADWRGGEFVCNYYVREG